MVRIHWDIFRWDTEFAFSNLQAYFEMMETQLSAVKEQEKEKIPQTAPPGLSDEDYEEWRNNIHWFEERYERDFPSKLRYSFIVLLHIILETRLRATSNEIAERRNLEIKETDFKGPALERVKSFLDKVAKISASTQETWQWLKDFQKVRDCIVHANGRIEMSRDRKRLNDLCRRNIGLSIDAGSLSVKQEYCAKTLEATQKFFNQLFSVGGFGPSTPVVEGVPIKKQVG